MNPNREPRRSLLRQRLLSLRYLGRDEEADVIEEELRQREMEKRREKSEKGAKKVG